MLSCKLLFVVPETPFVHFKEETETVGDGRICIGIGKNKDSSWEGKKNKKIKRQFISRVEVLVNF